MPIVNSDDDKQQASLPNCSLSLHVRVSVMVKILPSLPSVKSRINMLANSNISGSTQTTVHDPRFPIQKQDTTISTRVISTNGYLTRARRIGHQNFAACCAKQNTWVIVGVANDVGGGVSCSISKGEAMVIQVM